MITPQNTLSTNLPSPATDPVGPTGRLATWLADLKLDDVPVQVCERAKSLALDGLACAIVGAQLPWSRKAVEAVLTLESGNECTLIGWDKTTSAPAAALLNGTFIQGFELDDVHPGAPLHSASLVLPSMLACVEKEARKNVKINGASFLQGLVAGFETGPRIGLALGGIEMLSRGWHSGAVFGTHSSAAATGTLLHLDAAQFEDALGLAATQSCGLMAAQFEAMSKRMHHGLSSRNGLYAAYLARSGYTGIKRVFEREFGGFLSTFGEGHEPDASQIASGLGERWETQSIVIKPYATMGGLHAPLDALFDIASRRNLHVDEIEHVEVELAHGVYSHGWWKLERPLTPTGAQMNIAYAMAVGILDGAAMVHQFAPDRINQDDIWTLIPKIKARHNPEFDKGGPKGRLRTRVCVHFVDGTMLEASRMTSRANSEPQSGEEVIAKYRTLTDGLIDKARQDEIVRIVSKLEELDDVGSLIELLAPRVKAAFD